MKPERTLHDVKTALAEKYEHLARLTKSETRKQKLNNRAVVYRRQAVQITRDQK